ncbi:MAG TPA: LuxR C-terminal-related transcriptional regulator [Microlunatus sp.]|nr:LuxR C-terminal-related transcriptional regulator [Microlunatus sp.]
MAIAAVQAAAPLVGRAAEMQSVRAVIAAAREGVAGALLVTGGVGVGKTSLVGRACAEVAERVLVLGGGALPLTSLSVPLLALRRAVSELAVVDRPALFGGHGTGELLPEAPALFDEWLEARCAVRPVVLVIDDLQWADDSTLDVLTYVVAGSPHRRLALLMTLRRGDIGEGRPVARWLADVKRMPLFTELALEPLDRNATREQLAALLAAPPHESLVGEVFVRTMGNPYFNRLLVSGLSAKARHLRPDLPTDLSAAVLQSWHGLSPAARDLVRVIAVGAQVATGQRLHYAADLAGIADPAPLLREAVAAGVLEMDRRGGYWFRHPLQAEALEGGLAPADRALLHTGFARACERDLDAASPDLESITAIADHHYRAGKDGEAYTWALRAVDAAGRSGGAVEQLRLLRRAIDLHGRLAEARESVEELLDRLRATAAQLGDHEEELAAVDALLAALKENREPLRVAELMVRRGHLRFSTGRGFLRPDDMRRAVRLTTNEPNSWQHSLALAEFAHASLWHNDPDAASLAARALESARATNHPAALAYALAASAMLAVFEDRAEEGRSLASEAISQAVLAGDWWAFVHGALWEANANTTPFNPAWVQHVERRRGQLEDLGAAHAYVAWLSACAAGAWLHGGQWEACAQRLRVALGSNPGVAADAYTRLVAARLAALQGRQREAEAHLDRAEELFTETSAFLAFEFDAVRATVRYAAGDLDGVVDAAEAGATTAGAPPTMCEWLMPFAARALADQAQAMRDAGHPPDLVLERLDGLLRRFPHAIADPGGTTTFYLRVLEALDSWYAAEAARARRSKDCADRWLRTVELLDEILPWEEAYACWRAGEAILVTGTAIGHRRDEAAEVLRRGYALTERLRAGPIQDEIVHLAHSAHIPLGDVHERREDSPRTNTVLDSLTPREQEVLDYVVAGRTYREIARALVVSEKTVSTHVSHLLRKTGATNRVDLARLAARLDRDQHS